jgi:DNA adenine methylase
MDDMSQQLLFLEHQKIVNVASVPQRSPFRYPGGKTWLVPRVRRWLLDLHRRSYLADLRQREYR